MIIPSFSSGVILLKIAKMVGFIKANPIPCTKNPPRKSIKFLLNTEASTKRRPVKKITNPIFTTFFLSMISENVPANNCNAANGRI